LSGETIFISDEGEKADATHSPPSMATKAHFTDDEPISTPNKYFIVLNL
jgi:hypothetical protein